MTHRVQFFSSPLISLLAMVSAISLGLINSATAALVVTTDSQIGTVPFTPSWTPASGSLIAGQLPGTASGDFSKEATGRNVASLTAGGSLTINSILAPNSTCSTNYVTCGNGSGAGSTLFYALPASTNGFNLTNITVYGGWQDNGRDAQAYTVYYSSVSTPTVFTLLGTVNYDPPVTGGIASATRVVLADSAGGNIAANVAVVKFDFTSPGSENGYTGYGAITIQGVAATNLVVPPILITTSNQFSASSFTPTWFIETDSLIAGQLPSGTGTGDFANEAGVTGLAALTDGTFGVVDSKASFATCGGSAGQAATYFLNGATVTNIVVYSGWPNANRDGQFYNVLYSTVDAPLSFIPLASINFNPSVSGVSANRVNIRSPTAAPLATNVAFVRFDFTAQSSGLDNGYSGYAEIVVEGIGGTGGTAGSVTMNTDIPASSTDGADATLVFNEIMYHPESNEAGLEFIEFYNQLAVDLDISNWRLSGDTDYIFPAGTRVAGRSYIVLARNPDQLQTATGLSSNVFGPFVSPLDNNGGTLNLYNNSGRLMNTVSFGTDDDWPVTPDGAGPSLSKRDRAWSSVPPANWAPSSQVGGTPGAENFPSPVAKVTVAFNEFASTTNGPFWVELMNYGTNPVSLANYILHHDGVTNTDYLFPPGVIINGGAFLLLSNDVLGFIAPVSGEKLFLFAPSKANVYDGLVLKKSGRARSPDGTGTWQVPGTSTPGASNSFTFRSELVINEIMYNHHDFPAANSNSIPQANLEEWLEIYNRSSNVVDLTGWSLSGGISYSFPPGKTIGAGSYLIVARDAATLRTTYPSIDIVGNYGSRLGGEDIIILKDSLGNPANAVHYYDAGRWPEYPDGGGSSLELRDPNADNSKAEAWVASDESSKSAWQTFTYRMVARSSTTSAPDGQWRDFILGLLSAGECWLDDISVIQSPTNNPVQLISNGNFESGLTGWRVLGNHQRSVVETDPDNSGNHVLHVKASGAQEHMHNHIETTLVGGRAVTNGQLYEISYRARWIGGNNLLNTRLYFNRVARTTALSVPPLNGTPGAVNSRYLPNVGPTFAQFQHQPVVPQAGQPVTVFVRAQDPQGVSACSVFWSVNGGAWSSAPMIQSDGVYAGTIPGLSTSSLVQFYVQATDSLGAISTFPAKGTNSGALYRVNDGAANVALAHNLRILMSPANIALQYATTNLMSNENLPCTVIYDERQAYYDVTVRLKSSERGRVDSARIGFHLEFHPDELFRGVHPVLLLDRSAGGSRPPGEEILLKHMLGHAGIPAVNSDLCRVIAPQSAQTGMAILSLRFEDQFIANAFENGGDGTLFEYELTYYPLTANASGYKLPSPDNVQGVDISDLGNDKEVYRYNFIIKNHRGVDDYSAWLRFAKAWSLTGTNLDAQTRLTMDVDEWLRAYAMVSLGGVGDMYTFGGNHNLMTYLRPTDNRVLYFPWDMDFSFSQSATAPLVGDQNLGKIVNLPGNLRRFYAYVLDHINTTYNATYMAYWVNHYGPFAGQNYASDLSYITSRGNYAMSTINNAGGNAPFTVSGPSLINVSSNLVTLSGTAPVAITSLLINGVSYQVTWGSISNWTVQVPVSAVTNIMNVQGYGLNGNLLTNTTRTIVFNGTLVNPSQAVVFNELMYQPAVPRAQYIEFFNTATNYSFDLSGWRVNGLGYTFPSGSVLAPNNFLILAKDRQAFASAYGDTLPVFDQFDGDLDLGGETLTLFRPDPVQTNQEIVVDRVRYEPVAPWPLTVNGAALQLIDASQDNSRVANWIAVSTNTSATAQWVRVSATGIPRSSATSRPLYVYLQTAGDIYIDDFSVVAGSVAEAGVNLVTNGGFETSLAPWIIGSDGNNSASASVTNVAHSGSRSLHLIASSGGTTQNSSIWQDFSSSLTAGGTYTLSFWYLQTTNGGPLTARFAGSGISISTNPAPVTVSPPAGSTPDAANSVATTVPSFPPIWLNELQAGNVTGQTNNFGARVPWVELYNAGTNGLSTAGLYLAVSDTNLTQWAFPTDSIIPPNGFLLVWCDGLTNQSTSNAPHANFTLAASAGSVRLSRLVNGNVPQIVDYLNYTNLPVNWSYGDFPDGQPFFRQSMFLPTPGATNSAMSAPITISINEWMADNSRTIINPVGGKFDDWFELYNYGTNTVDLGGYYLTGTLTNKIKFQIPNNQHYQVPPHGFILVWADNNHASNSLSRPELHVNFKLSKSGEAIGLFAPDGTTIDALTFGAQSTDVTEGRYPDGASAIFSMPTPTPQTNNIIPNTAPVLAVIGDKYVHAGQVVQFTALATDAQSAYQALTFSISDPPPGAGINPTSGIFYWATTNATPGAKMITVRVADNGTPPLSDTKSFTVVIAPLPQFTSAMAAVDGQLQLTFDTLLGQNYQVQYKDRLSDPEWISLGGTFSGTGSQRTVSDDMTENSQRFYRLQVLP